MENILSIRLRRSFWKLRESWDEIQEIRLRSRQPLIVCRGGKEWFLDETGTFCRDETRAIRVLAEDIQESMAYICQYSLYAYEDEIRRGFITVRGGHRIGVAGQAAVEQGRIKSISCVSSLNIRISHQIKG